MRFDSSPFRQFTRDSVTGVPMVKKSMGRTLYPPPYACRV